jgi:hypothetical protein
MPKMIESNDFQGCWRCVSCDSIYDIVKKYSSTKSNDIHIKSPLKMLLKFEYDRRENKWKIISETNFETILSRFELDKEFSDETVFGAKVKSMATIQENKLILTQKSNENILCVISHEISSNGELLIDFQTKDIKACRVFQRIR